MSNVISIVTRDPIDDAWSGGELRNLSMDVVPASAMNHEIMLADLDRLRERVLANEIVGFGVVGVAREEDGTISSFEGWTPGCFSQGPSTIAAIELLRTRFLREWAAL